MHIALSLSSRWRARMIGVLGLAATACGDDNARLPTKQQLDPSVVRTPLQDSIIAIRNRRLAQRPDTFGMRADSLRIAGPPQATLWVIVTSDFSCPECRDFAVNVLPAIRKEFVDPGLVRLAFVHFPQDRYFNSRFAALTALCAARSGHFWDVHDSLYANQQVWERMPDPRPYMHSLAVAAGVPSEEQNDCMSRNRMLRLLTTDVERSVESGVTEVPTVFVGDRKLGRDDLTTGSVRRAIREALEKQ